MGGGDHLMSDVLEDDSFVQVDDVVPSQDVGHGGVHERDDDYLEENEYDEGDLQINRLDPLAIPSTMVFRQTVVVMLRITHIKKKGDKQVQEVIANVAEGDAEDIDRAVFAAH
ncbi:hypothetical protein E3N88_34949 [Mikania micrantha]|uniref:Uncharacterized protein n=1 Tax=Mikania micrantha TaxID=192012 RepID=A0A5N6LZL2_9ASTR|nr:hypothetical protein E3N88_34949 [Mikania micrantha]